MQKRTTLLSCVLLSHHYMSCLVVKLESHSFALLHCCSCIVALLHCIISRIIQLLCCHKVVFQYVVPFLHLCAVYCYCSPVILSHFNIVILLHCHTFVMWPCTDADVVLTHCVMQCCRYVVLSHCCFVMFSYCLCVPLSSCHVVIVIITLSR